MELALQDSAPKNFHSALLQLSVKLGHFSRSFSLTTCDTQQSLTALSTIQQVSPTYEFSVMSSSFSLYVVFHVLLS